jgi:hypothetical protein
MRAHKNTLNFQHVPLEALILLQNKSLFLLIQHHEQALFLLLRSMLKNSYQKQKEVLTI